ncbi:hypothetical protein C8R45DRAFT_1106208 [Mycena sanguinolenta]|nr:hypothetical protein C8R45DRAFT_1106208 [Mycena sanguinolenta]
MPVPLNPQNLRATVSFPFSDSLYDSLYLSSFTLFQHGDQDWDSVRVPSNEPQHSLDASNPSLSAPPASGIQSSDNVTTGVNGPKFTLIPSTAITIFEFVNATAANARRIPRRFRQRQDAAADTEHGWVDDGDESIIAGTNTVGGVAVFQGVDGGRNLPLITRYVDLENWTSFVFVESRSP